MSPPESAKKLATLSMREGQSTTIPFSRSLGLRERMLEFDATDPDHVLPASGDLAVSIGTFLGATEDAELNHDLITATAHAQNRGVYVNICVNRSGEPRLGDPGTYTGVVSVADPRVSRVDDAWIQAFPGDAAFIGEKITIHHVGGTRVFVPLSKTRHMDAHMPGGYRYNPGGAGGSG